MLYFPEVTGKLMMKKFLGISREHNVLQIAPCYKIQHKRKKIWPSAYDTLNFYSPCRWAPWLNLYHGSSSVKIKKIYKLGKVLYCRQKKSGELELHI